ncbi:MAG: Gfo/Idh/MocA family oxidoreductase, partial [Phycisphaerales bacterium]
VAACDVDKLKLERSSKGIVDKHYADEKDGSYKGCSTYHDFRDLLARPDIDAVVISTPDHWHTAISIAACRVGKDIYCEKPLTQTIAEARALVNAVRKYNRVFQTGSMQRSSREFRFACELVQNGYIGDVKHVTVGVGGPPEDKPLPPEPVPDYLDWDMWVGPAMWRPYNNDLAPHISFDGFPNWRYHSYYGGGGMTDWGAHHFGGATFAIDVRELEPEEVIFHNENGQKYATCRYPNGKLLHHNYPGRGNLDVEFASGQGPSKPVPGYSGTGGIYGDFIDCVKTRKKPFRDIELAVHTATVCHLFLIAYELERSLKWDTAKQQFVGDDEANRLVDVARREPWVI